MSVKDVLTVNDAAELLGISPYTVRKQDTPYLAWG